MPYCVSLKQRPFALRVRKHSHRKLVEEQGLSSAEATVPHNKKKSLPSSSSPPQQRPRKQQSFRRRNSFRRSSRRSSFKMKRLNDIDWQNLPIAAPVVHNERMEKKIGTSSSDTFGERLTLTSKCYHHKLNYLLVTGQEQQPDIERLQSSSSLNTTLIQQEIRSACQMRQQTQQAIHRIDLVDTEDEKKEDDRTTTMEADAAGGGYSQQELKDAFEKSRYLLDVERKKNRALYYQIDRMTSKMKATEECLMGDHLDNFTETIVRLQSEIAALKGDAESYRDQYQQEKQRRKDLQVRLNQSEHERRQMYDKMHVLMFEHLPAYSPKFNDIGRMDVSAEENDNMIGPYCIVSKIGKGCFGDVFRAVDSRSGRDEHYAIKCIKKTKFQRFKDVQQQAVEIHILKNYPHPNIIKLLDVVHGPENITVVMDLMQMDLHQYHDLMRRRSPAKQMSERDAKQVLFGILHPLAYLHSHGIAHLDIKPENILLDWNTVAGNLTHYNVRLSDFGLIKMADKPSTTRDVIRKAPCPVGTPGFFAPELVLGSKVECRIADMWSIGCVVMEITLGFTPEWMESYSAALSESSDFSDGIETELGLVRECEQLMENEELSQVINGLLHMDPSKRLTAEQTLAEPWLGEVLLVANQLAVKMSMEPTGSPSEPIQQETYDQRTHLVGPLPGYGHLVN